jgi:hypothetical protein
MIPSVVKSFISVIIVQPIIWTEIFQASGEIAYTAIFSSTNTTVTVPLFICK